MSGRDADGVRQGDIESRIVELFRILVCLAKCSDPELLSGEAMLPSTRMNSRHKIDAVCHYLMRSFQKDLDYRRLADAVKMEQSSLCRFFKRSTGHTLTSYLNSIRVSESAKRLIETNETVLQIGLWAGLRRKQLDHRYRAWNNLDRFLQPWGRT